MSPQAFPCPITSNSFVCMWSITPLLYIPKAQALFFPSSGFPIECFPHWAQALYFTPGISSISIGQIKLKSSGMISCIKTQKHLWHEWFKSLLESYYISTMTGQEVADVGWCDVLVEYFDSWQRTPEKKVRGTHLIKRDNFSFTHLILTAIPPFKIFLKEYFDSWFTEENIEIQRG